MPGIFGYWIKNKTSKENTNGLLSVMANRLTHVATYKTDLLSQHHVGIGKISLNSNIHNNVCIEPHTNIVVCLFGEIYEYADVGNLIANENSEKPEKLITRIYLKFGTETPQKLNGDFNIVLYDQNKEKLFIFNDRFGFRHLYYYQDDDIFIFAPEIKALMSYPKFNKSLDEHGLADYFNYSYHLGNRTMFDHVKLLPPAAWLSVENSKVTISTYWTPTYKNCRGIKELSESVETGFQLFSQSVKRRIGKSRSILLPLSGGLDSRLILAVAHRLNSKITTATFGIPDCLDYRIAKKVCEALYLDAPCIVIRNSDWVHAFGQKLSWLTEGNFSALGVTTQHGFMEQMGVDYDCFLNGIFGGHLTFGSPYFNQNDLSTDFSPEKRVEKIIRGLNGHRYDHFLKDYVKKRLNDMVLSFRKKSIEEEWERTENASDKYAFRKDALFLYNRIRRGMNSIDQNRFFYNDQLPFASYELFDFYLSLSPALLLNHFLYKEIYKNKLPQLARIPWQSSGVDLFHTASKWNETVKTLKKYFIWYSTRISLGKINVIDKNKDAEHNVDFRKNKKLRSWIQGILFSDQCLDRGLFDKNGLSKLLKNQTRGGSAFPEISKLVMYELWARNFLDQEGNN